MIYDMQLLSTEVFRSSKFMFKQPWLEKSSSAMARNNGAACIIFEVKLLDDACLYIWSLGLVQGMWWYLNWRSFPLDIGFWWISLPPRLLDDTNLHCPKIPCSSIILSVKIAMSCNVLYWKTNPRFYDFSGSFYKPKPNCLTFLLVNSPIPAGSTSSVVGKIPLQSKLNLDIFIDVPHFCCFTHFTPMFFTDFWWFLLLNSPPALGSASGCCKRA